MRKVLGLSLFSVLTLLLITPVLAARPHRNYVAHLSGPEDVMTLAQGQAIFHLSKDGTEIHYKLIAANIEDITMAHIHIAPTAGGSGPPAVWLYPNTPPPQLIPGRFDGVLAEGTFTETDFIGPLDGKMIADLLQAIQEGRAYVNVHTNAYPGGEIRGAIH